MYYYIIYLIFFLNSYISALHRRDFETDWNLADGAENIQDSIRWIEQPLDHFDQNETRKWRMRYYENLQFFKHGGPIYLFINKGRSWDPIKRFLVYQIANETNGAIIGPEHRYYGESIPLDPTVTENLKYLSSRQALADLAFLMDSFKSRAEFRNSKVVAMGGAYTGNLAAWMRLLYPNKIDAAIASSAVVLAQKNYVKFFERLAVEYKKYGPKGCYEKVAEIFNRYERLLSSADGMKQLKKEFNICEEVDLTNVENKQTFFGITYVFYVNNPLIAGPQGVNDTCKWIMNKDLHDARLAKSKFCYDYSFSGYVKSLKKQTDFIAHTYLQCTEFGQYCTTANSNKHPFTQSVPIEFFAKVCKAMFGPKFDEKRIDEGVALTNKLYGGLRPNVTKVLFVNGGADPWSELSVLKALSPDTPVKIILDGGHCQDEYNEGISEHNNPAFAEAKKYVKQIIKKWINFKI